MKEMGVMKAEAFVLPICPVLHIFYIFGGNFQECVISSSAFKAVAYMTLEGDEST